tara:strand:+ start:371 stop:1600 length:1230 start_codon:yes stop_codon:yes gene_type:complete
MGLKRFIKKVTKPIGKAVKKIVPKELAGIMQVAAPLAGPYAPLVYAAGAYKQSGRINPIAAATLALPYIGTTGGLSGLRYNPAGTAGVDFKTARDLFGLRDATGIKGQAERFLFGRKGVEGGNVLDTEGRFEGTFEGVEPTQGILGAGGDFKLTEGKLLSNVDKETGKITLSKTKIGAAVASGLSLSQTQNQIEEEGIEDGLSSGEIARLQAEAAEMWQDFDTTAFRPQVTAAIGGLMRKNLREGSKGKDDELPPDPTTPVNPFKPKPIGPVLPDKAEITANSMAMDIFGMPFNELPQAQQNAILELMGMGKPQAQQGGLMRSNFALGTRPTAQESGLGGLPIEADMRYSGGFMPYGAKEKADDVPARLSKNEFVFTADAVRAAGGGSINKGAKRMYNTMKQLESMGRA